MEALAKKVGSPHPYDGIGTLGPFTVTAAPPISMTSLTPNPVSTVTAGTLPAWAQPLATGSGDPPAVGVPPGVTLSVVGRTPGVPVVLLALSATATSPLGTLTVEHPGRVAVTHLRLAVTWTPPEGGARRRVLTVPVSLPPGATAEVPLTALAPTARLAGLTGAIEVALAGARTADGARYAESPGPVWATGETAIACADGQWQAHGVGTLAADDETGAVVRCAADGRWLDALSEGAPQ